MFIKPTSKELDSEPRSTEDEPLRRAVFTLATPDRIAHARVLLKSLAQHNPRWDRYVFQVGLPNTPSAFPDGLAIQRSSEDLGLPNLSARFVWYNVFEATNSLKPSGFKRLFFDGYDAVVYLDADIQVYSEFCELEAALQRHAIVLNPHLAEPIPLDDPLADETTSRILQAGTFNGGFLAMRNTPETRSFLDWWEHILALHCLPASCHDQAWLTYAPCFISSCAVLRHPGYNLAYWNLLQRPLFWEQGQVLICGPHQPVRFFHFSGFDWQKPEVLSKWDSRFRGDSRPDALRALIEDYVLSLKSAEVERWSQTTASLSITNRYAIPTFLREWLRREPAFVKLSRARSQGDSIEEAIRNFLLLPDRSYPWLPIFLGRTLDSVPGLHEQFPCESSFFLQDLATWFDTVGRTSVGFGSAFPSHGWWTEERGLEQHLRKTGAHWEFHFDDRSFSSPVSSFFSDYLDSLCPKTIERWNRVESHFQLSSRFVIPAFLRQWLVEESEFQAIVQSGQRRDSIEEAIRNFLLLPDRSYPWLPIFLGRTLDSVPGLHEQFPCESGFFLQDLATWFDTVGRTSVGFGSAFPSHGWWTKERGFEKHFRRSLERWLQGKMVFPSRQLRFQLSRSLRRRILMLGQSHRGSRCLHLADTQCRSSSLVRSFNRKITS